MENLSVGNSVARMVEENWEAVLQCHQRYGGIYVWLDTRGNKLHLSNEPDNILLTVVVGENDFRSAEFEAVSRLREMGIKGITDYYDFEDVFIKANQPASKSAA